MWSVGAIDREHPVNRSTASAPRPREMHGAGALPPMLPASADAACGFSWGEFHFGVADAHARSEASRLIARMYARRGYRTAATRRNDSPHRITLGGTHRGQVVATLTLGLDNPDGLFVDELYHDEVDAFRSGGRKLCEVSAFAVDPTYSSHGVLACLIQLAYLYGQSLHQVTDAFIEVNPRHVGFYERILHFRRIGQERLCPRVAAPAVLLHQDLMATAAPHS